MSFRPAHPVQNLIDSLQVELFGMDRISCPFPVALEIFVPWLEDHVQELLVTVWTSAIFRWTAALTGKADGRRGAVVGGQDSLQHQFMSPVVSEIVEVDHRIPFGLEHLSDRHFALVDEFEISEFIGRRVSPKFPVFLELMKVTVCPSNHGL